MDIALIMHEFLVEGAGKGNAFLLARALAVRGHQVTLNHRPAFFEPQVIPPQTCLSPGMTTVGVCHL
jgi:hypothetical protein